MKRPTGFDNSKYNHWSLNRKFDACFGIATQYQHNITRVTGEVVILKISSAASDEKNHKEYNFW